MKYSPALNPLNAVFCLLASIFFLWATVELYHFTLADIYAVIGRNQLDSGQYKIAVSSLQKSIRHTQSNADYYYLLGKSLYALAEQTQKAKDAFNSMSQAENAYREAVKLNPLEGNSWLALGQTCFWLCRFPGSERQYEPVKSYFLKAMATDPQNGKFLYAIAGYHLAIGQPAQAKPYLKELAMAYPKAYSLFKKTLWWSQNVREPLIEGLEEATKNPLTDSQALDLLASISAEQKEWITAARYTRELIHRSGNNPPPHQYINLGRYNLQLGNQEEASEAFRQALKFSRDRRQVLESLLWQCRESDNVDLYIDLCRKTAKWDWSVRSRLPLILAKAYFYDNNLELAHHYLRQSLDHKETAEAHRYLAEIALQRSDWDSAELESQRATLLEPENSHYYYLFARSLQGQKKHQEALAVIQQAIDRSSTPQHYYFSMQGAIYWQLGDYKAALFCWNRALELAPENDAYQGQIAKAREKLATNGKATARIAP